MLQIFREILEECKTEAQKDKAFRLIVKETLNYKGWTKERRLDEIQRLIDELS